MSHYKKVLGALTILGALAAGGTAFAQTASTTTNTGATATSTPGAPNTGAGGASAENYALLGGSALVVLAGAAYLARNRKALA